MRIRDILWQWSYFMGNSQIACGEWPIINIFESNMLHCLGDNEKIVGDRGDKHGQCISPDDVQYENRIPHYCMRAQRETCDGRFKRFGILHQLF